MFLDCSCFRDYRALTGVLFVELKKYSQKCNFQYLSFERLIFAHSSPVGCSDEHEETLKLESNASRFSTHLWNPSPRCHLVVNVGNDTAVNRRLYESNVFGRLDSSLALRKWHLYILKNVSQNYFLNVGYFIQCLYIVNLLTRKTTDVSIFLVKFSFFLNLTLIFLINLVWCYTHHLLFVASFCPNLFCLLLLDLLY